jgi:hypothetical protein
MGLGWMSNNSLNQVNQQVCWLALGWNTFGARMSHGRPWTHKTHHDSDSGEATTFPHIVYSAPLHGSGIRMAFCLRTPKWESRNRQGCTSCVDFRSGQGLNWSCSTCWELSNNVSHATYTQGKWVDSRLSMVGSQIAKLTPGLSFGHNLCCKCPNGSCEPILDIYTLIAFQWYNELLKVRGFDLFNCSLKFQESIGTPTPKMGVHLGSVSVLSHTLPHSRAPFLACTLPNPCLGHEPKARVATLETFL